MEKRALGTTSDNTLTLLSLYFSDFLPDTVFHLTPLSPVTCLSTHLQPNCCLSFHCHISSLASPTPPYRSCHDYTLPVFLNVAAEEIKYVTRISWFLGAALHSDVMLLETRFAFNSIFSACHIFNQGVFRLRLPALS